MRTRAYAYLQGLNTAQYEAACHGEVATQGSSWQSGPLLIIAGAGTGKTTTLAHRVAHLCMQGVSPERILLLTFTRLAAREMSKRAENVVRAASKRQHESGVITTPSWSGTFHGIGARFLRRYHESLDLDPGFSVLDRSDAADVIDLEREALGLHKLRERFPRKRTCLDIYSRTVNAQCSLEVTLKEYFPHFERWHDELKELFGAYVARKIRQQTLDYDDLLLYWYYLVEDEDIAADTSDLFDHILVDEYQDTNRLQAEIIRRVRPDGRGVTVVGDDAQSIYGFRAADVENILRFPQQFAGAEVIKLEENYRSTQMILDTANALMAEAERTYQKRLVSSRGNGVAPRLVNVEDEHEEAHYLVEEVLLRREQGVSLRDQAVLFRNSRHTMRLELELGKRDIPYVKYGGLKFIESAHVKDVLSVVAWIENPKNEVAAFRVMQLLQGIGPATARKAGDLFASEGHCFRSLARCPVPAASREEWTSLVGLLTSLGDEQWSGQMERIVSWYRPFLERGFDQVFPRQGDLEQLIQLSGEFHSRAAFLTELALDPPSGSGDLAGAPHIDEDFLILSTVHSAKGQEWDSVYVMHFSDGTFPNEFGTGDPEKLEEERRLAYVALTRSRNHLTLVSPFKYFIPQQARHGDRHVYGTKSRFLSEGVLRTLEMKSWSSRPDTPALKKRPRVVDLSKRARAMWS